MNILNRSLHWGVAVVCAVLAASMGGISGGGAGAGLGAFNGLAVGYSYVHFALRVRGGSPVTRLLTRSAYGSIAGLVSGGFVHVPGLFIDPRAASGLVPLGALAGIVIGTLFGFVMACILAFLPEPPEGTEKAGGSPKAAEQRPEGQELPRR